jgi:N6-L-threonylcarbamoyladenine synthase
MRVLSIETSCDDTGITLFEVKGSGNNTEFKILANSLSSQTEIHNKYGGVYPMLAKREHIKNLPILLEKTLGNEEIPDLICVTSGPGLEPALWTGITFAQELGKKWGVPVMPVNHMEGHVLSVFGKTTGKFKISKLPTPALALLVSGGHTELVLVKPNMKYEIIGETLDDAVGEAFDKVARLLGLPYPGGPEISRLAEEARSLHERGLGSATARARAKIQQNFMGAESGQTSGVSFPRPMLKTKDFNFSFSGLKTSVLYFLQKSKNVDKAKVALEFENAAIECITYKTGKAIEKYKIKTLIVGGGVAANKHLGRELKKITGKKVKLLIPTLELTRDNAVMIGIAGYLKYMKGKKRVPKPGSIKAEGRLRLV